MKITPNTERERERDGSVSTAPNAATEAYCTEILLLQNIDTVDTSTGSISHKHRH